MSACGTTGPSERDLLEASLQALIDHDSMDLDMFQGGPPIGAQTRRHFTPQIRHNHDAHHYLNTTTTTPQTPPSLPPWADAPSQHERAAPASRCRHNMGSGQVRYAQAIKDALLLLGAQSMHGGNGCYDCPQFPLPHLEFDAGGCATVNPYSNSSTLEDYDFTNPFPFLDYEPSCSRDVAMDEFYTINTPREPSPSALLPDTATTVAPPPPSLPTPQSQSAESPPPPPRLERSYTAPSGTTSRKRPNPSSTDTNEAASPLPSSSSFSQSGSPAAEGQKKERPHAAVEKRYRVSLNDKIEALRVCLESRKRPKRNSQQPLSPSSGDGGATGSGNTPAAGSTTTTTTTGPAARMSKAEVLSEAVEYVQQLEEENGIMLEQIAELVQRMQATQRALQLPSFAAGRNSF
ncbi:hypothetical protein PG987_007992 [Apiospora arundinis]